MTEIAEDEGRLAAALDRIEAAVARAAELRTEAGTGPAPEPVPPAAETPEHGAEVAELRAALEAERSANAQLTERVRRLKQKQETVVAKLERRVAQLMQDLEQSAADIQRQKALVEELTEANRVLREAAQGGAAGGAGINQAMAADLQALGALREMEKAEVETVLGEIRRLIGEGSDA